MRAIFLIFLAAATPCRATTTFTVTFSPNTETGNPDDLISFNGSLLNNAGSTVFINNDAFTFAIAGAVDDSPFLNNAPISLGPSDSSGPFVFLTVKIPHSQGPGTYDGSFTVLGGADGSALDNLGSAAFHLNVNSVATPEPSTLALLTVGGVLIWCGRRRTLAHGRSRTRSARI